MATKAELEKQVKSLEGKLKRSDRKADQYVDSIQDMVIEDERSQETIAHLRKAARAGDDLMRRVAAYGAGEEVILPPPHSGPVKVDEYGDGRLGIRAQNAPS